MYVSVLLAAIGCAGRSVESPSKKFFVSPDTLYVLATGRWVSAADSASEHLLISQINTVEMECFVDRLVCQETRANLDEGTSGSAYLLTATAPFEVQSVSDGVITARARIGVYETELRIDVRAQSVQRFARWRESSPGSNPSEHSATWMLR
jgi:hypothetical protein